MEKTGVVTLARVLKVLVTVTFLCNLVLLPLVPAVVGLSYFGWAGSEYFQVSSIEAFVLWWLAGWLDGQYTAVLSAFLICCGSCTAVILWQARRVLKTIVAQDTFVMGNARNMMRAAVCCFLISGAALARTVWGFFYYRSIVPLFTYNALFVPIFLMGGLLCMVMSALFRQAAELKEENDLTI